jgi:hypothetical protein
MQLKGKLQTGFADALTAPTLPKGSVTKANAFLAILHGVFKTALAGHGW